MNSPVCDKKMMGNHPYLLLYLSRAENINFKYFFVFRRRIKKLVELGYLTREKVVFYEK